MAVCNLLQQPQNLCKSPNLIPFLNRITARPLLQKHFGAVLQGMQGLRTLTHPFRKSMQRIDMHAPYSLFFHLFSMFYLEPLVIFLIFDLGQNHLRQFLTRTSQLFFLRHHLMNSPVAIPIPLPPFLKIKSSPVSLLM